MGLASFDSCLNCLLHRQLKNGYSNFVIPPSFVNCNSFTLYPSESYFPNSFCASSICMCHCTKCADGIGKKIIFLGHSYSFTC